MGLLNLFSKRPPRSDEEVINQINKKLGNMQTSIDRLIYLQEKEMAIEKQEVIQLLSIVGRLIQTNVEDKAQIESLKSEAATLKAQTDWLNDPELDSQLETVLASASGTTPAPEVPSTPGEPVEPAPVEPPVTDGPAAQGAPFVPPAPEEVPTSEPTPEAPATETPATEEAPAPSTDEQNQ